VDGGVGIVAVFPAVVGRVESIAVCVVVRDVCAVGVDAVVGLVRCAGEGVRISIVAVVAFIAGRVESVSISVVVACAITVGVDSVVEVVLGIRVCGGFFVITVVATVGI